MEPSVDMHKFMLCGIRRHIQGDEIRRATLVPPVLCLCSGTLASIRSGLQDYRYVFLGKCLILHHHRHCRHQRHP